MSVESWRVENGRTNGRDVRCLMFLECMLMIPDLSLLYSDETRTTDSSKSRTAALNTTLLSHPSTSLLTPHPSHPKPHSWPPASHSNLQSPMIYPLSIHSLLSDTCHVLLIILQQQLSPLIHMLNSTSSHSSPLQCPLNSLPTSFSANSHPTSPLKLIHHRLSPCSPYHTAL